VILLVWLDAVEKSRFDGSAAIVNLETVTVTLMIEEYLPLVPWMVTV
jgi:hypothetical protein